MKGVIEKGIKGVELKNMTLDLTVHDEDGSLIAHTAGMVRVDEKRILTEDEFQRLETRRRLEFEIVKKYDLVESFFFF